MVSIRPSEPRLPHVCLPLCLIFSLEAVFYKYGVDFIVEGHEHSYERLYPVFNETVTQTNYVNPKAPVHFISGQAGCNEAGGLCVNPTLGAKGEVADWLLFACSVTC